MARSKSIDEFPRNLREHVFGRLTVIDKALPTDKNTRWLCRCVCGNEVSVHRGSLIRSLTKSCGCLNSELAEARGTTHGFSKRGEYRTEYGIWAAMKRRCTNPMAQAWKDYGGRGITVCTRWESFENFLADMGKRPPGKTLDRFPNNDGNYEPSNCRWATRIEQANNSRGNRMVTFGTEQMTIAEACSRARLPYTTVYTRIVRGWPENRWFISKMRG